MTAAVSKSAPASAQSIQQRIQAVRADLSQLSARISAVEREMVGGYGSGKNTAELETEYTQLSTRRHTAETFLTELQRDLVPAQRRELISAYEQQYDVYLDKLAEVNRLHEEQIALQARKEALEREIDWASRQQGAANGELRRIEAQLKPFGLVDDKLRAITQSIEARVSARRRSRHAPAKSSLG